MRKVFILLCVMPIVVVATAKNFTVISEKKNHPVVATSRVEIQKILLHLNHMTSQHQNIQNVETQKLVYLSQVFGGVPYGAEGAEGEGDWQPNSLVYRSGGVHIQQDPVYRTDQFDCQTLVEIFFGLLHARNLNDFDQHILKIEYGAAGAGTSVHYYNRNNFVDADFNPVNEKNDYLYDATTLGMWKRYFKTTSALIDRNAWFHHQVRPGFLGLNVRVLSEKNGRAMAERLANHYPDAYVSFKPTRVSMTYIPKAVLVQSVTEPDGVVMYRPRTDWINQLPVPSVIEIVRDPNVWMFGNKSIQDAIGTQMNVSHLGFLYRENFLKGEVIARNVECQFSFRRKTCRVIPEYCTQKMCTETMMMHATDAYPNHYFYYGKQGHFYCTRTLPKGVSATRCNRVVSMPLGDYLVEKQNDQAIVMDEPSILGIHLEKLR